MLPRWGGNLSVGGKKKIVNSRQSNARFTLALIHYKGKNKGIKSSKYDKIIIFAGGKIQITEGAGTQMNRDEILKTNKHYWDTYADLWFGTTALPDYGVHFVTENELHLFEDVSGKRILEIC